MGFDPIVVTDVVLDTALTAHAELVRIDPEPATDRYVVSMRRAGEVLANVPLDARLASFVIARLGYVCGVDSAERRTKTGRTRVRSCDAQRDVIVTIQSNPARAELVFVDCARTETEPVIGDRIGHYRVVSQLGAGGMGNVYEVEHERLGRRHALKVLQRWMLANDREAIERFLREAQAAARIRNSHIVEVFDFGYLADGRPYIVMEHLAGQSLAHVLATGPLEVAQAIAIGRQLASALTAAHERAVIHADVSPANVFVTDGHVTLIDFGLAYLRTTPNEY
jgi:hypothetical protein